MVPWGLFRTVAQGALNGPSFLVAGYFLQRLNLTGLRAALVSAALAGVPAAIFGTLIYVVGWTDMLVGTGDARDFAVDSMANTFSMALLFFTHLQHSRAHADAAERLGAAKVALARGQTPPCLWAAEGGAGAHRPAVLVRHARCGAARV